jgi:exodeoxyribonuclease V alpha subunit
MEQEYVSLSGIIENIIYRNNDNGWTVIELNCVDELVTVVGFIFQVSSGDELKVQGEWVTHSSYGKQFKANSFERCLPATNIAILKYLSSGAIKGIGATTAQKLVEAFGINTLDVIENEPQSLLKVKGITAKKAAQISDEFKQQFGMRSCMLFLQQYNVTAAEAIRIWKRFGVNTVDLVKRNPYILCDSALWISFDRADTIADAMGIKKDDEGRLRAGIVHVMRHNLYSVGHTYAPYQKLAQTAAELLDISAEQIECEIDYLTEQRELIKVNIGEEKAIFLPDSHKSETYCAGRIELYLKLAPLVLGDCEARINEVEQQFKISYAKKQREAIAAAYNKGLMILTGGPGTGKTTTINAIIRIYEGMGLKVVLCAPTGRAAKRMSEVCGKEAKTIHRLLEMEFSEDDVSHFARNERNQLDCDAIIVDELSMVDVFLLESLLRAMKLNCRLVMVGDANQLPPVGAGNVLKDMINSEKVPFVELDEIFRQAAKSLIVMNAHKIVKGEMPDLVSHNSDFFFMPKYTAAQVKSTIKELVELRLPAAYGFSPLWDIQVLTPGRKGELGTMDFNNSLQEVLNPAAENKTERQFGLRIFREGDKVMQIKNNYDLMWEKETGEKGSGVFNGDIGILQSIEKRTGSFEVKFDDRTAEYASENIDELELAYAITVHKSQGSEFKAVVLALFSGAPQLLYRNLLYTAVTRARELVVIVGRDSTIRHMVENNKKTKRYTGMEEFLRKGFT